MEDNYMVGTLSFVSKIGGIKLEGNDQWINPTKELRAKMDIDSLKGFIGEPFKLRMTEDGHFEGYSLDGMGSNEIESVEIVKSVTETPKPKEEFKSEANRNKKENYFNKLMNVSIKITNKFETKKTNLNYISWADSWKALKTIYPEAQYRIYEDNEMGRSGLPYFSDKTGGMVKVGVTISKTEHIIWLPIMKYIDKQMASVPIGEITTFQINSTIMRALVKAAAMHGCGLFVYQGNEEAEE